MACNLFQNLLVVFHSEAERLLSINRTARSRSGYDMFGVQAHRSGDQHGVDVSPREKLLIAFSRRNLLPRDAIDLLGPQRIDVADRRDGNSGHMEEVAQILLTATARSNHSQANRLDRRRSSARQGRRSQCCGRSRLEEIATVHGSLVMVISNHIWKCRGRPSTE